MIQKYYSSTGKIVLFDTISHRITSEDKTKTFGKNITAGKVEFLIRNGSLSPAESPRTINH